MSALLARLTSRSLRPDFRYDIAGLRAIAVLLVVLGNFELLGFSGGFIGPDIFFVISGYLITGILYREFEESKTDPFKPGRISMSNFYLKRVRRIFPVAFFVLLVVNVFAQVRFTGSQLEQIQSDSIWTFFFASNINFLHQSTDFFAQTIHSSPFLHYWSLAIEEQFYLIWPMFFLFAANMRRMIAMKGDPALWKRRLIVLIACASLGSAAWLIVEFSTDPKSAYFSTFGRVWELGLGGILCLVDFSALKNRFESILLPLRILALCGLLASVAVVTPDNFGYLLFLPALMTGFLLASGADQPKPDLINRILSNRLFTAVGAISFSLYLWQWPTVVFGKQLGYLNSTQERLLGVLLAIIISTVTYWLIEKPAMKVPLPKLERLKMRTALRPHVQQSSWRTGSIAFGLSALLIFLMYPAANTQVSGWQPPSSAGEFAPEVSQSPGSYSGNGQPTASQLAWRQSVIDSLKLKTLPSKLNPPVADLAGYLASGGFSSCSGKRVDAVTVSNVCESLATDSKSTHKAVVLGDSHARMLWPAILRSLDTKKWDITLLAMPGCPVPALVPEKIISQNMRCAEHREKTLRYLETVKPDLTILSDSIDASPTTQGYRVAYLKVMPRISAASKYVVVVTNTPKFPNLTSCLTSGDSLIGCKPKTYVVGPLDKVQRQIINRYKTGYWDASEALCAPTGRKLLCPAVIGTNPVTVNGSLWMPQLSAKVSPFFRNALYQLGIQDLQSN